MAVDLKVSLQNENKENVKEKLSNLFSSITKDYPYITFENGDVLFDGISKVGLWISDDEISLSTNSPFWHYMEFVAIEIAERLGAGFIIDPQSRSGKLKIEDARIDLNHFLSDYQIERNQMLDKQKNAEKTIE